MMEPNDDGPFCLLCEDDTGELIRFTTYVFHPHTWQPEPRCYLIDLYSTPKICGKGIGLTLIAAVYEKVDKHDCCQVYWLKLDFNEAGRRLYDKVAKLTPFIKYQR
jgi:GNAT superfamily N-acetyltransferase